MTVINAAARRDARQGNAPGPQVFLPLDRIETQPKRYHARRPEANGFRAERAREASRKHVQELTSVLQNGHTFDPIIVMERRDEGRQAAYVVLDGHHRLRAYHNVYGRESRRTVPCRVWQGNELDAWLYAMQANVRTKLPMSTEEKTNAAWMVVTSPAIPEYKLSDRAIARMFSISASTVGKMRKVHAQFYADVPPEEIAAWRVARQQGLEIPEREEANTVDELYAELEEAVAPILAKHPMNASKALSMYVEKHLGKRLQEMKSLDLFDSDYDDDDDI